MARVTIVIADGDSELDIAVTLVAPSGSAYDFTGKTAVFRATRQSDNATVHVNAIIGDPASGVCLIPQGLINTGPGTYAIELQVLLNSVVLTTQPTDGGWTLLVRALETQ